MKFATTLFLVFWMIWGSGCASPRKGLPPVASTTVEHSDLLINDALIDQKIRFLEKVLADKTLCAEDRETASGVLDAYRQLKKLASSRLTEKDYQRLTLSLFRAVNLMDEAYYGEKRAGRDDTEVFSIFEKKRQAVIDLYLKRDFKGVIEEARQLKKTFGPTALTHEIGLLFALALAEEGNLEEAVETGEAIADQMDPLPDVIQLRSGIARWQLSLGRQDRALQAYERLTDNQNKQATLVQEVSRQIRTAEKEAPADQPVVTGPAEASAAEEVWGEGGYTLDQLLQKVGSLVREHAYSKARLLILRERIRMGEGPESEILDRELEKIDQHEAEFKGQKEITDDTQKEIQETARQMIEEENYQAAIDVFTKLEATQALDAESIVLKERAVEGLVNKERNRAAQLFLAARKTGDPSKKKELLDSAHQILKGLIDQYPSSPLNQKLRSHIVVVEREMENLK